MSALVGKVLVTSSLALLASMTFADRLVNVPTARPLSKNAIRFEYLGGLNNSSAEEEFVAFSVLNGLEFEVRRRLRPDENGKTTFDLGYNILSPVASTAPGISLGVLDGLGETVDGRRAYIALTFRELLDVGEVGENGDMTLGYQTGSLSGLFIGISLPFSGRTRMIVEHNGARLTSGFETDLVKGLDARIFIQDQLLLGGISFSRKF
jgi:hypothetical protein